MDAMPETEPRRATFADWIEGARLRTLPLSVAPPVLGWALSAWTGGGDWIAALLCLIIALALQIGVNFANDYSDGIRGTDDERIGPLRLTGAGLVAPRVVKIVAFGWFGVAAVAGLLVVWRSGMWWLVLVGVVCVVAAWTYTGGKHPYGYAGLGEVVVFVFFGLVATIGTVFVSGGNPGHPALVGLACALGLLSAAVLMINNLRDIETDVGAGKRTLAVRLGRTPALGVYAALMGMPYVILGVLVATNDRWLTLGFAALPIHVIAYVLGRAPKSPTDEINALKLTSIGTLVFALLCALGILASLVATPNITHVGPLQ